jgi:hypothetical protein
MDARHAPLRGVAAAGERSISGEIPPIIEE